VVIHHVRVIGRVQGVGFRQFVRDRALALGLSGWVKNRADGSVELLVGGETEATARLLDVVRVGPPHAAVAGVESLVPASAPADLPHPFTVVRE